MVADMVYAGSIPLAGRLAAGEFTLQAEFDRRAQPVGFEASDLPTRLLARATIGATHPLDVLGERLELALLFHDPALRLESAKDPAGIAFVGETVRQAKAGWLVLPEPAMWEAFDVVVRQSLEAPASTAEFRRRHGLETLESIEKASLEWAAVAVETALAEAADTDEWRRGVLARQERFHDLAAAVTRFRAEPGPLADQFEDARIALAELAGGEGAKPRVLDRLSRVASACR